MFSTFHAAAAQFGPQCLGGGQAGGFGGGEGAVLRPVDQRVDRQQVDEGGRRVDAVGAAGAHDGTEMLRQAQQAKVASIHLLMGDGQAVAVHDAADAGVFGGVDQDIDAMRQFARHVGDGSAVGDIEGNDLYIRNGAQSGFVGKRFPGIGDADEDD